MKKFGFLSLLLSVSLIFNIVIILIVTIRLSGESRSTKGGIVKKFSETTIVPSENSKDKIALIQLTGLISYGREISSSGNTIVEEMEDAFHQAGSDPAVKAIIIAIDSPGGEVTAGDTIYHSLVELNAKKPVIIFMRSIATSAAYYIACAGSWIMCSPTSLTGSIGVIISTLNYKELFGKIGLHPVIFKSGQLKDALNGARDLNEAEKNYFQNLVMQTYDRFLNVVASSRHIDLTTLRAGIADGRVLSGSDAYAHKLVDQLGYMEDAYKKARLLGKAPSAQVVRYEKKHELSHLLHFLEHTEKNDLRLDLNIGSPSEVKLQNGFLYMLPFFYAL